MNLNKLKAYLMPISMIIGICFHTWFSKLGFLMPYLIFSMLLIAYSNITINDIKVKLLHLWLLIVQIGGSIGTYYILKDYSSIIAQGGMICILAPTATSAVVITGMLGGNITSLTTYSLLSNLVVVLVAPIMFTLIGYDKEISFWTEVWQIGQRVFILLLLPFLIATIVFKFLPKKLKYIQKIQSITFYLWNLALIIATARTVNFLFVEGNESKSIAAILFFLAFIICCIQFLLGRKLGKVYDDTIAGGQGLGQKNTILAIWMVQTYLNPLASIAPGGYILWQNLINSFQVWKKQKLEASTFDKINK